LLREGKPDNALRDAGDWGWRRECRHISSQAKSLIKRMIAYNSEDRPSMAEVAADAWFQRVT
jgi:serine/threonine protein kinase